MHEPLWKPYILSCRTNDEIFVCLKYWLLKSDDRHQATRLAQREDVR